VKQSGPPEKAARFAIPDSGWVPAYIWCALSRGIMLSCFIADVSAAAELGAASAAGGASFFGPQAVNANTTPQRTNFRMGTPGK
jgi:hypothetical protein